MAVKCLTEVQKDQIVFLYSAHQWDQINIAARVGTSARTVNRVLNERGLLTAVPRIKAEAYTAMQVLKKYSLSVKDLEVLLTDIEQSKQTPAQFVEDYLQTASEEELGRLFWAASKARIKQELAEEAKQYVHQQDDASWETHVEVLDELPF